MARSSVRGGKLADARGYSNSFDVRLGQFSIDRIDASVKDVRGIEKQLRHTHSNCRACMIGGARKLSTKQPTFRQFSYNGQRIASDL
eukprot:5689158-Pleurochrysis_carterae.AAC.1